MSIKQLKLYRYVNGEQYVFLQDRLRGWFPRHCAVERIDHEEGCKIAKQEDAKKNK